MAVGGFSETQVKQRVQDLCDQHQAQIYKETDQMFIWVLLGQWFFEIALAIFISPRSWYGAMSKIHIHVWTAILLGGIINLFPVFLAWKLKGQILTRYVIAAAQMSNSALLIHLTGGRIETHFHVFGSLAILAFYRDWKVLIPASLVVVFDHALRGIYWPQSVYGVLYASAWRSMEHAAWVVFEDVFLVMAALKSKREMFEIAEKRVQLEIVNHEIEKIVSDRTSKLQENEARLRAMNEASPFGLFVTDVNGDCLYVNPTYERISSLTSQEAMGRGWLETVHPDERERVVKEWYAAIGKRPFHYESVHRYCGKGNIYWVKVKAVAMMEGDKVIGYVGALDDISDQKEAEKKEKRFMDETKRLAETTQKKSKDLERFQQLAVGRELEMVHLKKEINELLVKMNLPKKYHSPDELAKSQERKD